VGRFYKPVERNALESRSVADNKLFYGDNLDVLRRYVHDESVDLICGQRSCEGTQHDAKA
jgi:hypothetical protein